MGESPQERQLRPVPQRHPRGGGAGAGKPEQAAARRRDRRRSVPAGRRRRLDRPGRGGGGGAACAPTQLESYRAIVRVMALKKPSPRLGQITPADGWKPKLPVGFAAE